MERLRAELDAKGRMDWHAEICRRQITASRQIRQVDEAESWRIKGGKHLTGRAAAVLRELWRWREEAARKVDRPPFKVAPNELLLLFALWAAENPRAPLAEAPEPPAWLNGSRLKSFHAALAQGLALASGDWPGPPPPHAGGRRSQDEELLLGRVLVVRDEIALRLEMDPGVLGSRETLREVVRRHPRTHEAFVQSTTLMEWQIAVLAPAILPVLQDAAGPGAASAAVADESALGEPDASGIE